MKEVHMVRDGITEWVEKKMMELQTEILALSKLVVVLTENALIEQGIAISSFNAASASAVKGVEKSGQASPRLESSVSEDFSAKGTSRANSAVKRNSASAMQ